MLGLNGPDRVSDLDPLFTVSKKRQYLGLKQGLHRVCIGIGQGFLPGCCVNSISEEAVSRI